MTVEAHRQNRVLNHGFIYAIGLYVVTYLVALSYFYFLLRADFPRYWPYFWPFTAACLLPAAATLALFFLRGRHGFSTLATVTTYLISLAHNLSMLLFLGLSGGFQFFLAALIPAAYLAHPHRRSVYIPLYLTTLVTLFFGVFWNLTHKPLYPVPEPFASITFYTLLGTSSTFFLACFVYVAYKYDWVKRVMVYWEALSVYGLRWTDSDEERTHHIITNQTMVLHAIFPPVILFVSFGLSVVLLLQGTPGWWKHLLSFASAALISSGLWLFIFLQAAKRWRAGFLFVFLLVDIFLVTFLVLLTGNQLGIEYFYFALIPFPIYFFPKRRRLFTSEIFVVTFAMLGVFLAPKLKPLLDIPRWIIDPIYLLAVSLSVGSAIVGIIYVWWQRKITQRIFYWWERISLWGVPESVGPNVRKHLILTNRGLFILVLYTGISPVIIIFATALIFYLRESVFPLKHVIYFGGVSAIMWPIIFVAFFAKIKRPDWYLPGGWLYQWGVVAAIISGGLFIVGWSIGLQSSIPFYIFFAAILFSAFLFIPDSPQPILPKLIACSVIVLGYTVVNAVKSRHYAIMPIWDWAESTAFLFVHSMFLLAIILIGYYTAHESNLSGAALELAHQKSESLLLNILPRDVADELKDKGHAAPVRIESVTVMFTDFAGFTKISESLSPEQVVDELDKCFSYFDQIMEKYNLEKLKTIGDSYMCAGGIPKPNHTHAIDCCLAAMEIQAFMNQMKDIKAMQGLPYWELRLGIHTGPLVAGVVGHKKFAYDVWGDTVNTASRMESSGTTGKINISRETQERVKFLFDCEHRGQVAAKNKGMIDMFYLNGLKHRFSKGGEGRGRVPNARFREVYAAIARGATLVSKGEHTD